MGLIFQFDHLQNNSARRLSKRFYQSSDILTVARQLLGKVIVTDFGVRTSGVIIEVEAYKAPEDKASHAYGNRRTGRTEVMFASGGHAYVYLCYGIHHMFNVVSGKEGEAHAILVRAVEPLEGTEHMLLRRGLNRLEYRLTAGPGSLAKALGIHTNQTGENMLDSEQLWIEDRGEQVKESDIDQSRRIGIDYAEEWKDMLWRFSIRDSKWVSR